ncbi:lipopolysaccharide kinase InaA family protein [Stutzerimonas chloritidismutans]|uniref:Lipopolysaccharide kinase InaA family protein n=1 Tax=Stutzerimonas chloritidismutans TaxID=203192 RepID=A0ABU9M1X7_STUCH
MRDFISSAHAHSLRSAGLDSFDALWRLELTAVDAPNAVKGGWSSVYRLDIGDAGYYLKRQSNYLSRSWRHPFGEPTFAAEFRNIRRYQQKQLPTLDVAFFAQLRAQGEVNAVLLTRALDGWRDLSSLLDRWSALAEASRNAVLASCGKLARQLHGAGEVHGCFYPKHIFLREHRGAYEACLIDLEKTRLLLGRRDRLRDLEALVRRAELWREEELRCLLASYLDENADSRAIEDWLKSIRARHHYKAAKA